jgi:hypothetical protein
MIKKITIQKKEEIYILRELRSDIRGEVRHCDVYIF